MSLYGAQRYGLSFTLQCFPEKIFAKRRKDKAFSLLLRQKHYLCLWIQTKGIMSKKFPIGIQSFEEIRANDFFYIDKTDLVYQLATRGKYYFLGRPRRFGKSLLVSTLEAYFQGKKELFKGLAMEQLEQDWKEYPVLHLDLNTRKYKNTDSLPNILNQHLEKWEALYGDEKKNRAPEERFTYLIQQAATTTGRQVVILIDEYDKPLLQAIGNEALAAEYRSTLKAFYGVVKSCDPYIRFALLTGVSKFSKVSVFSDLNNLLDISMDRRYATLCGITEEEIHRTLEPELHQLADATGLTYEETCQKLRERYDGYHFCRVSPGIYNPFSLLCTFDKMEFGSYWFETGTPTFLVELLKRDRYNLYQMAHEQTTADVLNSVVPEALSSIPVLYQAGYLTLKGYDSRFELYQLGFPNKEVEEGFINFLLPSYARINPAEGRFQISRFVQEVEAGDIDAFFRRLQSFFADTPYELARDLELHYQNILYIVFKLIGFYVQAEYHTSEGRIDLVLQTDRYVYVMEFKLDGTAEEALQQIEDKRYALPFATDKRQVFRVGVNFSNRMRNIERWLVK